MSSFPSQITQTCAFGAASERSPIFILFQRDALFANAIQGITQIACPKLHWCESYILVKRPTLAFSVYAALMASVCLQEMRNLFVAIRPCNPTCFNASCSDFSNKLNSFQNEPCDACNVSADGAKVKQSIAIYAKCN